MVEDEFYSYKSKYDIKTKDDLIQRINDERNKPMKYDDAIECKISDKEIEEIINSGKIISLNTKMGDKIKDTVYFPGYNRYNLLVNKNTRNEMKLLWDNIPMPTQEIDVVEELKKKNLYVHLEKIETVNTDKKKKKEKKSKQTQ